MICPKHDGGRGTLELDLEHLHHVFRFACDNELIDKNPVVALTKRRNPHRGAHPFSADELIRLHYQAKNGPSSLFQSDCDWLPFLLLRWTGMRRGDAVMLAWNEIFFDRGEIEHVCEKNRTRVIVPISKELHGALAAEHQRRRPSPSERVLLNPRTGKPFGKEQLWQYVVELGERAGVEHAHTHRFRDTFAVDMLLRSKGNVYHVAQMLGDTLDVVMKYYLPYVRELRERSRLIVDSPGGLEEFVTSASQNYA